MAKMGDDNIAEVSYIADADLSGIANLYRFVSAASTPGNVKAATGGSNPRPLGVLLSTGSAGQAVGVKEQGHVLLTGRNAGCNLNNGQLILCASDGCAQSASVLDAADGIGYGIWLGPNISSGSAIGEALLFGHGACILARS